MYYALNKASRLRKEPECVVLFAADDTGNLRYLHPIYGVILALCNGQRTSDDLLRVLTDAFGIERERASGMLSRLLADLGAYLTESREPQPAADRYDPLEFLYQPAGDPNLRRLTAPVYVAWLVTERCPFDCVYCCIRTLPANGAAEGEMTREEALAFLADCVESGVQTFTFHGGEPFLRKDTPELIGYLIGRGVFVTVSTKLALPDDVAARLADAGLEEMQVSIDTPDAAAADRMVGHANYLRGALRNIELLQRHGIAVKTNTVVTSRNVGEIPRLIRFIAGRGVRKITLSGYLRSFWKHDDALLAGEKAIHAMAAEVDALRAELPDVDIDMCPLDDPRDASLAQDGFSACSGGKSGLVVGADGRVSICDRLLAFDDAIVGNVREESLMNIWNSERLMSFVDPDEGSFAGTECDGCGMRENCDRRIRCYYRSRMIRQRLFAPDHLCSVVPAPTLRFF
ncbi:MAG TPA: radical SAM protein [Thermoanaerobaculia bacterium]|nr:radical SAM protein [Thermoanaerobaculia bacterium]